MFSICYGNSHVNNADVLNVHIKGKSTKMYWLKYINITLSKQIKTPIKFDIKCELGKHQFACYDYGNHNGD